MIFSTGFFCAFSPLVFGFFRIFITFEVSGLEGFSSFTSTAKDSKDGVGEATASFGVLSSTVFASVGFIGWARTLPLISGRAGKSMRIVFIIIVEESDQDTKNNQKPILAKSGDEVGLLNEEKISTIGHRSDPMTAIGYSEAKTDNSKLATGYIQVASNGDMISSVKNDVNGIGYISLSTLDGSGVTGLSYEGVKPSESAVLNGTYKMTRNFNYIVRASYGDEKVAQIVAAYRAFLGTSDAKATMKELGGILTIAATDPTWTSIKANYAITSEDNKAITIHFGGSTSVENMREVAGILKAIEDIERIGDHAEDVAQWTSKIKSVKGWPLIKIQTMARIALEMVDSAFLAFARHGLIWR